MSQVYYTGDTQEVSKYFKRFQRLAANARGEEGEDLGNLMNLKGDMILVEKLPKVEVVTRSGIIIASAKSYKETANDCTTEFGVVLMVGPGQYLEDGSVIPCDSKPGDVILLPANVAWYSAFGNLADYEQYTIGRLRDSQVGMTFTDYKKVFEVLNEKN